MTRLNNILPVGIPGRLRVRIPSKAQKWLLLNQKSRSFRKRGYEIFHGKTLFQMDCPPVSFSGFLWGDQDLRHRYTWGASTMKIPPAVTENENIIGSGSI